MTKLRNPHRVVWDTPATRRRPAPAPIPRLADRLAIVAGVGFLLTLGLAFWGESLTTLEAAGGWMTLVGRLTGLSGTYLMVIMVILISRVPWLERSVGQDRLVAWHRRIGGWPIALITLHVILITWGYAQTTKVGVLHQFWTFLMHYPDMMDATVAFGLLVMAGVTSMRIARHRMKYETWWTVHLYIYLALVLAFFHQTRTGVMFIEHPLARETWTAAALLAGAVVVLFRVLVPVARNLRHRLRVVAVSEESPGVYSVIVSGRRLSELEVSGGQFFQWRFLAPGLWWHSHPYSLSALPQPPFMRVTVKGLGDQSRAVAHLRVGTRVIVEGPYGRFTHHARTTDRVLLVGAGVGITPLRALLEDLPETVDVTMLIRASSREDIPHRDEIAGMLERRGGRLVEILGPRERIHLTSGNLKKVVGHLRDADVYVCGPRDFNEAMTAAATALGARPERIHEEAFSF